MSIGCKRPIIRHNAKLRALDLFDRVKVNIKYNWYTSTSSSVLWAKNVVNMSGDGSVELFGDV